MTRATRALLHLDIAEALRMNALYVISLPFLGLYGMLFWGRLKRAKGVRLPSSFGLILKCAFVLVILWLIMRNIPHPFFEWARPTPATIFDR